MSYFFTCSLSSRANLQAEQFQNTTCSSTKSTTPNDLIYSFGSDFDGIQIPQELGDVTGLPKLVAALAEHGYDEVALRKIAHENWLRILRTTWREET